MSHLMDGLDYMSRGRAFTECPRGSDHELDHPYIGPHHNVSHYQGAIGVTYVPANLHYSPVTTSYSAYTPSYAPSSNHAQYYVSNGSNPAISYQLRPPPRSATLPSQSKPLSSTPYYTPHGHSQHLQLRNNLVPDVPLSETEDQQSENSHTMKSEAIEPPLEGYPNVNDFENLMKQYVAQLSPKKQDKALIHARRAANIKTVLLDKKTTTIESAQFRFWVKKMFELQPQDSSMHPSRSKICHEGKPVAIREKLFKILSRAHQKCQHGGRDKTSAQVRRVYSWVPKELISRFVKICPTCQIRRGLKAGSTPIDGRSPPDFAGPPTPSATTPQRFGDDASVTPRETTELPLQLVTGSPAFQSQNRWLSGFQPRTGTYEHLGSTRSVNVPKLASSNALITASDVDQVTSSSRTELLHLQNDQTRSSRSGNSYRPNVKQESHYCFD